VNGEAHGNEGGGGGNDHSHHSLIGESTVGCVPLNTMHYALLLVYVVSASDSIIEQHV
jgi:hypothetical protein